MKRRIVLLTVVLFIVSALADGQKNVVFEATIVRLEPWGVPKISCGAFANYRLAEYKIDIVYSGTTAIAGQHIIAQHLACNYNELDDLKPGDKVLVVASVLRHPRTAQWDTMQSDTKKKAENVTVLYSGDRVAKIVYPTEQEPRRSR